MTKILLGKKNGNIDTLIKEFNKLSDTILNFKKEPKYSDKYIIYVGTRPVRVIDEEDLWKKAIEEINKFIKKRKENLENLGICFNTKDVVISDDNQYKSTAYIICNGKRYDLLTCILKRTKKGYALSIF